ncbi:hypothetical protein ACKWTF_014917 [Chironomus riparius]
MLKFIILPAILIVFAQSSVVPEAVVRVAGSFNAGKLKPKCFTTLHISFPNSDVSRTCGGCLISFTKVITSGNCVTNPQDGTATNIKFSFGGVNNKRTKGYGVSKIALAPGYNYAVRNSSNDLAVVTLTKAVKLTPQIQTSLPYSNSTQDAFVGQKLLVCGFGYTDDKNKYSTSLKCTYLTAVGASVCTSGTTTTVGSTTTTAESMTVGGATTTVVGITTAARITTIAPVTTATTSSSSQSGEFSSSIKDKDCQTEKNHILGPIICAQGDGKSNVCHGDEGSPVFAHILDSWTLIGVVSSFPNSKACLDNHNVKITQLGGFTSFIASA